MYQNIVFDLYGTLVDIHTDETKPEFWQKVADYYAYHGANYEPQELRDAYENGVKNQAASLPEGAEVDLGNVFAELYTQKNVEVDPQRIADTAAAFRKYSMEKLRLFDGTIEMLEGLQAAGKKIYLLSNAQALFTRAELKITGLEGYFDGILLSSDAGYKKPSKEFYGLLTSRFSVNPEESLMVGNDDVADCHGASQAGMDSLYIYTEQSPKQEKPLPENCHQITEILQVLSYI